MNKLACTLASFALLSTLACGGVDQAACEEYVDAYNAAYSDCQVDSSLDKELQCDASLNEDSCNQEAYYQCLRDAPRCAEEGIVNDISDCDPSCAS